MCYIFTYTFILLTSTFSFQLLELSAFLLKVRSSGDELLHFCLLEKVLISFLISDKQLCGIKYSWFTISFSLHFEFHIFLTWEFSAEKSAANFMGFPRVREFLSFCFLSALFIFDFRQFHHVLVIIILDWNLGDDLEIKSGCPNLFPCLGSFQLLIL